MFTVIYLQFMITVDKEVNVGPEKKKATSQLRKKLENAFFMWLLLFIGILHHMTNETHYYPQTHCV